MSKHMASLRILKNEMIVFNNIGEYMEGRESDTIYKS